MALIYEITISESEFGNAVMPVTNLLLNQYGVTEEDIYEQCVNNIREKDMLRIMKLPSNEDEIFELGGLEDVKISDLNRTDASRLILVSNKKTTDGAAIICDPEILPAIAERLEDDLLVIPSSIHEFLVSGISESMCAEEADSMIQNVNEGLMPQEVLGNHAYAFSRETGSLMLYSEYENSRMERDPMKEILRRTAARKPVAARGDWER